MRILFIAPGYLPYTFSENLCNAKLVYTLQKRGWEVDVISKTYNGPAYCSEWQEPWLSLKEHTYEIYYPVGNKISRLADFFHSSLQMGGFPINGIRWARRAYSKALELHSRWHYDAVLTRSPSDISHIVGYKIKQKTGIQWIANWNDPATTIWPEPYTHHLSPKKFKLFHKYTTMCLEYADINTFPSQTLLEHFQEYFPFLKEKHTVVIPHISLPETFISIYPAKKKSKMYMCHSGNLSVERNPELTFKAIKELVDEGYTAIQFDIMGHINEYTEKLIEKYDLKNFVHFIGSYPYMEAIEKLQEYDVLILLEAILKKGIFFASKFTDYAQVNRPILAISPKNGFANSMLTAQGGGIAVSNEDYKDIKNGILTLYKAWQENILYQKYNTQGLYNQSSPKHIADIYNKILSSE
ncbi:glycosyltransferase [Bacteroides sp.]